MLYVALNNVLINGKHGAFPEEKVLGNTFIVNVKVGTEDENAFIDYGEILDVVQSVFAQRENYLETLLQKIEVELKNRIKEMTYLRVSIRKKNPPLSGEVESSEVILEKSY